MIESATGPVKQAGSRARPELARARDLLADPGRAPPVADLAGPGDLDVERLAGPDRGLARARALDGDDLRLQALAVELPGPGDLDVETIDGTAQRRVAHAREPELEALAVQALDLDVGGPAGVDAEQRGRPDLDPDLGPGPQQLDVVLVADVELAARDRGRDLGDDVVVGGDLDLVRGAGLDVDDQLVGARELDRVEAVELAQLGRRGPAAPQAAAGQQGQGDGEREQTNDGGVAHGGDRQPRSKRGIASLASGWHSSAMLPLRRPACV